tara:strand:- start:864 stop:1499 length:636 start_codon:yes stop_codon:yes gene_type:complete
MQNIDATYNASKNPFTPIEAGIYPAHITGISSREVKVKGSPAVVFNFTYRIADEAKKLTQVVYEMDGYKYIRDNNGSRVTVKNGDGQMKTIRCTHLVGREFTDKGTFLFTGDEGSGRNRGYLQMCETLGVKLETKTVDGEEVTSLGLLEHEDAVGKPVFVKLGQDEFVTKETRGLPKDQQETRKVWKVFTKMTWSEGKILSADEVTEDVPF